MKVKLSAVIITHNEAENIERCISSLKDVAEEIIVIDSFSSDKTVEIAKSNGAIVFQNKFKGYSNQKKFGIYKCSSDYILSLDADECLSKNLQESIKDVKKNYHSDAYEMNRKNNYLGQWINHCGWYPDKKIRLFDKNKASWNDNYVHEKVVLNEGATTGFLKGDILHYSIKNKAHHYRTIDHYSTLYAQMMYEKGKQGFIYIGVIKAIVKFLKLYFYKLGILDGINGWRICKASAYSIYLRNKKCKDLYNEKV